MKKALCSNFGFDGGQVRTEQVVRKVGRRRKSGRKTEGEHGCRLKVTFISGHCVVRQKYVSFGKSSLTEKISYFLHSKVRIC